MFGNKNENNRTNPVSNSAPGDVRRNVIAEGTVVIGDIIAEGDMRVEGKVMGTLVCNSKLVVSGTGFIEGNIDARMATIEGEVKGNVITRELLTIDKTGKIFGDIFTQKLVVQMGAIFTGSSKMADAAKEVLTRAPQRAKDLLGKSGDEVKNQLPQPQGEKVNKP
ncbi:MAG: polymer-forming cytoskeletal protein [Bacteroidetes bacterium]|jgi:cytoskeletal protein CcmA (bactofilin family)|nr:MAG: polymer-forming cytoskeletal protein [Bacteroidota bacterium]